MVAMKIFGQPVSTDVARVLACLFEKNMEFELIRADNFRGEHKTPEFLKLQDPSGQIIFEDGKRTLVDSREICRYICDKNPNMGNETLYGAGVLERSSVEQWLQAEALSFEPPSSVLVFHLAFAPALGIKPDEELIRQSEKKLSQVLDIYDKRLNANEYLDGNGFTLADLSHLPNTHYLANMTERGRELFFRRKNVKRWVTAMSARPAWKKVVEMQGHHPSPIDSKKNK